LLLGNRSGGLLGCPKERRALEQPEAKGDECNKHDRLKPTAPSSDGEYYWGIGDSEEVNVEGVDYEDVYNIHRRLN